MMDNKRTAARIAVFVGLVLFEAWLARSASDETAIRGYVDVREATIAPALDGILVKLDVVLGQPVSAGQVIAELDGSALDAELAVKLAERKQALAASHEAAAATPTKHAASDESTGDRLRLLDAEISALSDKSAVLKLTAPFAGVIETVDGKVGDAVSTSTRVATVVAKDAGNVVACVPEARLGDVHVGTKADVHTTSGERQRSGVVASLTLAVSPLPPRCQPVGKAQVLGRVALVLLDPLENTPDLAPGQGVVVTFGGSSPDKPVAPAPATRPASAPALMQVPAALSALSRFEPSGLVWVESRSRFVVESDETGVGDAHDPLLFTMNRDGVVDPQPLVVEGVKHLDDVEAVAAAERGALWLLSSQSVSEKGGRPKAREQLLHLVPSASSYKVDAKVRVAPLLEAASASVRASLGVVDVDALDLEGVAYRGGALYIGLKAPVDEDGRALIWRVAAPDRLLAGDLAGAGVTVWGRLSMSVEIGGSTVPGGIADMVFVDDKTLLVGATASGLSGKHQTGALYEVSVTADELVARPLRTFPDLKPEGVALSPNPGHAMVVFDRGKATPMWVDVELPRGAP